MALLLGLTSVGAQAQTSLFVNDASTTGDIYTSAPGNDETGNGTAAAPFASVNQAIAAAAPGATIFIDAGRYQQTVEISKLVSLQGAGDSLTAPGSATIFHDGPATPDANYNGVPAIHLSVSGTASQPMRISRMSLRRYDYGIQTIFTSGAITNVVLEDLDIFKCYRQGVELDGNMDGLTLRRVSIRFTRIQGAPQISNNDYGRGLFCTGTAFGAARANILIENCAFEQNRRAGIDLNERATANLVIRNSRFYGNLGPAMALLKVAGLRDGGGSFTTIGALIEDNVIEDNASNGLELKSCTGNGLGSGAGSFVVRRNRITRGLNQPTGLVADNAAIAAIDRDRSIDGRPSFNDDLSTGGLWIESNFIRGYRSTASAFFSRNGFGIVLEGSNYQVRHNIVTRCQLGIQVQDRPATTSEQFTPFFDIPRNQLLVSSGVMVQENRVDSCDVASIRAINLTNPANVSLNWLGSNVISEIRGANGTGGLVRTLQAGGGFYPEVSSSAPTGRLQYSPFLNNGTDVSAAAGFQPDLSYLRVAANVPDAMPAGNLQEASAAILDGGTIEAEGGTYSESVTVTKNVTLLQTNPSLTLRDLTLNGSGKALTLGAPLTLSGNLTLTAGLINSSATNLLTLADGSSSTEGNAGSYVQGPLSKVGSSAFVFPLGQSGVWARLGISAPTAGSTFTAEYLSQAYPNQPAEAGLTNISRVEYWNLTRPAGSGDVSVRLYWENGARSGINSLPQLRVARFDGTQWANEGNGGTTGTAAAGSIVSAGAVSGFGPFTFGSTSPINPLPVELTSFRAEAEGEGRARLYWTTAQEKNNRGFEVERALNGGEWRTVGFVAGHGNSTQAQQYSYLDASGLNGTVYYRLKQLDFDGQFKHSAVVAVQLTGGNQTFAVYPNPARTELNVQLPQATTQATVQILDATGRTVWTSTLPANSAKLHLELAGRVKPGLYVVRVSGPGLKARAQQLVVE